MWIEILRREVGLRGARQIAKELNISRPTVDLVLKGTYGASTQKVQARVKAMYGHNGAVDCPVLGDITPNVCADNWGRAKRIGMKASNPETLRLYSACVHCAIRIIA